MPLAAIEAYMERIELVKAELKMTLVEPILLPNTRAQEMKRTIRRWEQAAGVRQAVQPVKGALAAMLRLAGIGVHRA